MLTKKLGAILLFLTLLSSGNSYADDTELYVFESSARSGARAQVLVIFDNSGSMSTSEYTHEFYERENESLSNSTKLYFSIGGTGVPELSSKNYFFNKDNGCRRSRFFLKNYGMFTGFIREYGFIGENGSWNEIKQESAGNVSYIDCFEDFETDSAKKFQNANGVADGFPVDGLGNKDTPIPYTYVSSGSSSSDINLALEKARLTDFGTGKSLTLYTEKYVTWYHSTKSNVRKSRLDIAKRVMEDTIVTTPAVDFGLMVFNQNYSSSNDGGRVVSGIDTLDSIDKKALINTISDLGADTWTPLCESLYEAYRYFAGLSPKFAFEAGNLQPPRDTSIESGGKYISPFKRVKCQNKAYVVLITDGSPTRDTSANSAVSLLPGYSSSHKVDGSYLPALAYSMFNKDINSDLGDKQIVTTYTIGFSSGADDAAPILNKTAVLSDGKYFAARSATELQSALQQALSDILEVNASFTSPSIASNNFDRTQTFDSVYYAMFLPNKGPRWRGNLKKFKVSASGDVIDKSGTLAIGKDGSLKSSACSIWTPDNICAAASDRGDGNDVTIGGVAHVIKSGGSVNRKLYADFGSSGGISTFSLQNAESRAGGSSRLASFMGVSTDDLDSIFEWAKGNDVDDDDIDGNRTELRPDVMGDPLHSKPLAINFGSSDVPDVRVLVGTNHGFLHMFKDKGSDVEESWAFYPYELLPNLRVLRANVPTGVHSVYGLDSSPVGYVKTSESGVEKAWVFVGMRRGGKSYYAFDITNPDSPKVMWRISADQDGFKELGQTWAEPVVTLIPGWPLGNVESKNARPVLIFGAGYSPTNKDGSGVGLADDSGRGVFIVDAETGKLVHYLGAGSSGNYTKLSGISDSIPNSVAVLDSNGDRLSDRIYATDTGGNVWRMDLPSGSINDGDSPWTSYKLASLGGDTLLTDRRFFAEPTVVQTIFSNLSEVSVTVNGETQVTKTYQNVPYDAVVIGSGHRPHPSDKSRNDRFFALQDRNVVTRSFTGEEGKEIPMTLTLDDLYDVTTESPSSENAFIQFGKKRGWYYSFGGAGEKTLSGATIVKGRVYFTSYLPGSTEASNQCLVAGEGRLYAFDLHKGGRTYESINSQDYLVIGQRVPDTPQLVIPPNTMGKDNYMYLVGIGAAGYDMKKKGPNDPSPDGCPPDDNKCVGVGPGANRIYYHEEE